MYIGLGEKKKKIDSYKSPLLEVNSDKRVICLPPSLSWMVPILTSAWFFSTPESLNNSIRKETWWKDIVFIRVHLPCLQFKNFNVFIVGPQF